MRPNVPEWLQSGPRSAADRLPRRRLEYLLDPTLEGAREREGQGQARVVLAGLDRVHRLARYAQPLSEVRLRPIELGAQDSEPVLHRYRNVKTAVPTPHKTAISGRMKVQLRCGKPAPSRNP